MVLDQITLCGILLICSAYFFARNLPDKNWILYSILLVGLVHAVIAILQFAHLIDANHETFSITGLMGNPGQLGGFQSAALVCTLSLLFKTREKGIFAILLCVAILIFFSLILSDSRAGLFAAVIGISVLSYNCWIGYLLRNKWLCLLAIVLIVGLFVLLYLYRPESVDSRLLVWRVCTDMFADKPLTGYGIWGFNHNYMLYQGEYLLSNPNHRMYFLADNVTYPYNEAIRILVEQGLIGFVLVVIVLVVHVKSAENKKDIAPLITFLIFSMFSYPSYKLGLVLLFPLLLGVLSSPAEFATYRKISLLISLGLVVMCIAFVKIKEDYFISRVSNVYESGGREDDEINRLFIANSNCIKINSSYSTLTKHFPEFLNNETIPLIFPSSDNWCILGDYYLSKGDFDKSGKFYTQASYMTPGLVTPKYLLWKLYVLQGKMIEAQCVADSILRMQVKVENTTTLRLRNKVLTYDYSIHEE